MIISNKKSLSFFVAALSISSSVFARIPVETYRSGIVDIPIEENFSAKAACEVPFTLTKNESKNLRLLTETKDEISATSATNNVLGNSFINLDATPEDRSNEIKVAALAAAAAYNHTDTVKIKQTGLVREQNDLECREQLVKDGFEIITFSANIQKNSLLGSRLVYGQKQAGFISYKEDKETGRAKIIVSFHGTEDNRDLNTDANGFKSKNDILGIGYVHSGFKNRYNESRDEMLSALEGVLSAHDKIFAEVDVLVTGHSLGGALAHIAAVDLQKNYKPANLNLITFCSPRVFDKKGAEAAETFLPNEPLRLWRQSDPISTVSLGTGFLNIFTGYKHVGNSIKFDAIVDKYDLANHDMGRMLSDAESKEPVKFSTNHIGIKQQVSNKLSNFKDKIVQTVKKVGSKLNPLNWFNKKA